MRYHGLLRRLDRLEQRATGGECVECTKTAIMNFLKRLAAKKKLEIVGISSFEQLPCPQCGNPNPKIPMRVIDALMANKERSARIDKELLERKLKAHPEWAADPIVDAFGDVRGH